MKDDYDDKVEDMARAVVWLIARANVSDDVTFPRDVWEDFTALVQQTLAKPHAEKQRLAVPPVP